MAPDLRKRVDARRALRQAMEQETNKQVSAQAQVRVVFFALGLCWRIMVCYYYRLPATVLILVHRRSLYGWIRLLALVPSNLLEKCIVDQRRFDSAVPPLHSRGCPETSKFSSSIYFGSDEEKSKKSPNN
jgi:hypothetical protein